MEYWLKIEFGLECRRLESKAATGALDDAPVRRRFATHEQRDAHEALEADDSDFRRAAVLQDIEQRDDACRRKIDVTERRAGFVQHRTEWQVDRLEQRQPSSEDVVGERCQQVILFGMGAVRHS